MERNTNINIFLSACKKLGVKSLLKNADAIEKLEMQNWTELLKTLQSFSKKVEKNNNRLGFKLEERGIKDLIDKAKHATITGEYNDSNVEIYGSPYQETLNPKDLDDRYNLVSCTISL